MRALSFLNSLLVGNKGKTFLGGNRAVNSPRKDFSLLLTKEFLKQKTFKGFYKKDKIFNVALKEKLNKYSLNCSILTEGSIKKLKAVNKEELIRKNFRKFLIDTAPLKDLKANLENPFQGRRFIKDLPQFTLKVIPLKGEKNLLKTLQKKKRKLLTRKTIKQLQKLKLSKPLKRKKLEKTLYDSVLHTPYTERLHNSTADEEVISKIPNSLQNKKALLHYKNGNVSVLENLVPLKGKERKTSFSENFGFFNPHSLKGGQFLNHLREKFQQKKVFKLVGAEYNRVKKVFSLKIPLDEQTVLKISAVKNNFYAQITTGAERVNLLIQNLQTLTQQIASLGFSSTVIKVQTTNGGSSNGNFNGKGNTNSGNNKDKNVSNNRWKVENNNSSFTSFSFYL